MIRAEGLGFTRATGDFWCRFMLLRDFLGVISLERCFLHRLGIGDVSKWRGPWILEICGE